MDNLKNAMQFARDLFADLELHWSDEPAGIYCPGYSLQENEAMDIYAGFAERIGMERHVDLAGNNYFVMTGQTRTAPVFLSASHVDAVPLGGRYDGRAGVVAGLAAAKYMHDNNIIPPQDFVVVAWRNEESAWFGVDCLGSRLAVGGQGLAADFLETAKFQRLKDYPDAYTKLSEHMLAAGINFDALKDSFGQPLFPLESVGGGMEVHIEQERSLLLNDKSLGIVTAIRGNMRTPKNVHFYGQPDHSGACAMNQRKDAARALIHMAALFDSEMGRIQQDGRDIVWTVPELATPNASTTTVCQHAYGKFEVRSTDLSVLEEGKSTLIRIAKESGELAQARLELNPDDITVSPPAIMDVSTQKLIERVAGYLNISHQYMPSGAGHDSGILAKAGVPMSVLFTRHAGRSHLSAEYLGRTPDENPYDVNSDFANGIRVLAHAAQVSLSRAASYNSNSTFSEQLKI